MTDVSDSKRNFAFEIWQNALDRYSIDIETAGTPFLHRWVDIWRNLSDEMVVAADILWAISNTLSEKSVPVFESKLRDLVLCRQEDDYLMKMSELEVAGLLSPRVSPIAFEPVVPINSKSAAKPSSSDYSINLPCGEVFIEATTIDLRNLPLDAETILKRLKRKVSGKSHQAVRDRLYLIALKILGQQEMAELVLRLITERIWPNSQFRRYGGILLFSTDDSDCGRFAAGWLPNHSSTNPPSDEVHSLFCGRRCFHLQNVNSIEVSDDQLNSLRQRVAAAWEASDGIGVPCQLVCGPLDGIRILLRTSEVGHANVTYRWDIDGKTTANGKELSIPPHGPVQIGYMRRKNTVYSFAGFRLWIDEKRPNTPGSEFLPRLHVSTH